MPDICLFMVAKDEEWKVQRALDSARPFCSSAVIVVDKGDPLESCSWPDWVRLWPQNHFAWPTSFNKALTQAEDMAPYTMRLDADDWLEGDSLDISDELDGYALQVHHQTLRYWRPQIFKSKSKWYFDGKAGHEGAYCINPNPLVRRIDTLRYVNPGSSDRGPEKFARDADRFEKHIKTHPLDTRAWFYYAQSLRDAGRPAAAYAAYSQRIALGGWPEEVYLSYLNRAHCMAKITSKPGLAYAEYMCAAQYASHRSEGLYHAAEMLRLTGDEEQANMLIQHAATIPYPEQDTLFVDVRYYQGPVGSIWRDENITPIAECADPLEPSQNLPLANDPPAQ